MTDEEKWYKEASQRFKDKLCREFKVSSVNDLPIVLFHSFEKNTLTIGVNCVSGMMRRTK